jgi:hypothetical protein
MSPAASTRLPIVQFPLFILIVLIIDRVVASINQRRANKV